MPKIAIIAAHDCNRLIGNQQQLPWHLSADLKRFKKLTWGHKIIMGRKTFTSIGKPLPGRLNVVVSQRMHLQQIDQPGMHDPRDGLVITRNIAEAIQYPTDHQHIHQDLVFIIGGQQIYQQSMDLCDILYITLVKGQFSGDAWFPEYDLKKWQLTAQETGQENHIRYDFLTYQRTRKKNPTISNA